MTAGPVTLTIDALELSGIAPAGRFEVARGIESELARLLGSEGVPPGLLAGGAAPAPLLLDAATAGSPVELGRAVARALYEGWR